MASSVDDSGWAIVDGGTTLLHQLAELGEASALVAAAVALIGLWLAIRDGQKRTREAEVLKWQRLVVYEIIKGGVGIFDEIRVRYVVEAQQYDALQIRRKEISNDALKLALLSLIEAHLISYTVHATYAINVVDLAEQHSRASIYEEFSKRTRHQKVISDLLQALERDSGKFSIDQAFRHLEVEKSGFKFEEFDIMVREYANRGFLVFGEDDKLWLRNRVPQNRRATPPGAGT
jgi:hypothetical protein